jgi:Flp pilus assembly pilin Flp
MQPPLLRFFNSVRRLIRRTEAQDLIEYGVLVGLLAGAVLLAASSLGVKVPGLYSTTSDTLPGEDGGAPGQGNPGTGNPGNAKPVGNAGGSPAGGP